MILVVEQQNAREHAGLLDEMFRLRKRVFCDRLQWTVASKDDLERDRYDDEDPVYLIHTDEAAKVVRGSLRLLPTTGPTLLSDMFSDTIPDGACLSAPSIWECTRFCVDDRFPAEVRREQSALSSGYLIAGLGKVALNSGISTVLGNFDVRMLRIYRALGCDVEVLGCTRKFGQPVYLGSFAISDEAVRKVEARLKAMQPGAPDHVSETRLAA